MPANAYKAGGTIHRARFVKVGAADNVVLQADADARILGISQLGGRAAPIPDNSNTTEAATSGESLMIYDSNGPDDEPLLELGETVARGTLLKSDANGKGIAADEGAGTQEEIGAVASVSGVSGDLVPVRLRQFTLTTET